MDITLIATIILGATGILVTIVYSWQAHKLAHEQMQKQLFKEFNERYAAINDFLVDIQNNCPTMEQLNQHKDSVLLKRKVNDFFNLCAEEFFWWKYKSRIDDIVWESWQKGMNYWYNNVPAIKAMWEKEMAATGKRSYYITDEVEFFKRKQ
jgi:hypothetical protein